MTPTDSTVTEQISAVIGQEVATKSDIALVRADMEKLELRMTLKLFAAVPAGAGLTKALDLLIG